MLFLSIATAASCGQTRFYLIFLTNWNVVLNAMSSVLGAVLVTCYYRKILEFEESRKMSKALKIFWVSSLLSTVVSISLSCVYWPLIYTGRDKGFNDALTHAANAIFMFVDVFISASPYRYGLFIYPLGFGVFYAYVFSVFYVVFGGNDRDNNNYIYSVLDWNNHTMAALTFSTATIVFLIFIHFVISSLLHLRIYFHRKLSEKQNIEQTSSSEVGNSNIGFSST